ncbi:MAG: ABC transporter ATP-binding protein [bacterium]|nr:ABC transporter ATP-binding protein [bacterium]
MDTDKVVEIKGVNHIYNGAFAVHALVDLDLDIKRGDFASLMGPSGSGKTTLLNLIGGIDHPTEGSIKVGGVEITEMSNSKLSDMRRDKLGFVFQSFNLIPTLSAAENVEFALILKGMPKKERTEKVREILSLVGLDEAAMGRQPNDLSGGQQQRVAVARAIVAEPALILADEPTANLDTENALGLLDIMARLNEEKGATFLFSTHDPRVMKQSRRIITLLDGEIAEDIVKA